MGLSLRAAGAVLIGLSCGGGDITTPATGSIEIITVTSGPEPDADGYAFAVDGGASQPIGVSATATLANVASGVHTVRLSGVAANCTVQEANPRSVIVSGGATAEVSFAVTCAATTGSLQVSTTTTGTSLDLDGYAVSVDGGMAQAIGTNATLTIGGLATGSHTVELSQVAANCRVEGENPRSFQISAGAAATGAFSISCSAVPVPMIAFESIDDGADIFVVNSDGTGLTNLTHSSVLEFRPAWSPDRTKIAFVSDNDIYVMNADGTDRANLTHSQPGEINREIRWSRDGSRIAFTVYRAGEGLDEFAIWIVRADGSGQTRLLSGQDPSWSPDGDRIAFVPVQGSGIYIINSDGSGQAQLVPDAGGPVWSPDGARIAFISATDGRLEIETINPDGTGRVNLTRGRGNDRNPVWSPDGSKIAFELNWNSSADIGVMNPDGSGRTNVTNDPAREGRPTWAPDGGKIAFARYDYGTSTADIYVANADGTGQINVSNSPATFDDFPAWASR